jgi:ectoine hydroxylase-related dioxygenase (phytanoyl-CoA dioxygenase family)
MKVLSGTQSQPLLSHHDTYDPKNILSRGQEIEQMIPEEESIDIVLSMGQMSLHHPNLIHGSKPNKSKYTRSGFVMRFITPDVRQLNQQISGMLVHGTDKYGIFQAMEPPKSISFEDALDSMTQSAGEQLDRVMKN